MNGNPNNRNAAPPKQINRIAVPIQVTPQNNQQSQINQAGQTVNPNAPQTQVIKQPQQSALAQAAQNQSVRGFNAKKQTNVVKEYDPSTMIFVVVLLIILACLCAFIFYVILPRIEANKKLSEAASTTPKRYTTTSIKIIDPFKTTNLNNGNPITSTFSYAIDNDFNLSTIDTGNGIEVFINSNKVTTTKRIFSKIGRVDEFIVLILADGDVRNNRVVIYDKSAKLIREIKRINNVDGMLLYDDASGYIFNNNTLVILASRVKNDKIILNNEFGSVDGFSLCDEEKLQENNINDNYLVMARYLLTYNGNSEFSDLVKINNVSLQEYRDSNNLCR